jgi:glycine betaine/proline transport system permease protein
VLGAVAAVVAVWVAGRLLLGGRWTLDLGRSELTGLHTWLNERRDALEAARPGHWLLDSVIGTTADGLDAVFERLSELVSVPHLPRPVPDIGWLGVLTLLVWLALAVAGWRCAVLVGAVTTSFLALGVWSDALDLLLVTAMSVAICAAVGVPLAIWMASRRRVSAAVTPVLEAMQTMPAFAYLLPLALLWGIGPAAAIVITVVYALPPLVRIAELGLRGVPATTLEAARSLGAGRRQLLRGVRLPMARRTIVVGVNQCTMAALSMATVAALVDGPGLGQPVVRALSALDVGGAFVAGLAIVLLAVALDRTTTAASERTERRTRTGAAGVRRRRVALVAGAAVTAAAIWLSHTFLWAARPPEALDLSRDLADLVNDATASVVSALDGVTGTVRDLVTYGLLNPLQGLLADSPWWLTTAALGALALLVAGVHGLVATLAGLAVVLATGLWHDAMVTLAATLVATLAVLAVGVVAGVVMGRSRRVDLTLRPVLDGLQTIPAFVYLVPVLALFGPTRFTAVVAAVLYGVPIATKLVADGIRGVPATTVEAAVSAGSTRWQVVSRVQLPLARESLVLAANQGLLNVLAMVVIGGLVGGGGLGYLVVAGFSQGELFGKGLAAAIAITALGLMLDRTTRAAAARTARP